MGAFCVFAFAALVVALNATSPNDVMKEEWEAFKVQYDKTYKDAVEEQFRRGIFLKNKEKIAMHNQRYYKGEVTFGMAMNPFGDLTHQEYMVRNGFRRNYKEHARNGSTFLRHENVMLPDEVDWVKKGYVTEVKRQGECGSCYAFSATGALEGQHKRKTGDLVSLSEQNLVDCSGDYGNTGCVGGLPEDCFTYIQDNKGVDTEESYPYEAKVGTCKFKASDVGATDTGFADVESRSEDALQETIATMGPCSAGIDANHDSFKFYSEGVFDEPECSSVKLCHAILVVGYGNFDGQDYWLVKNSWGEEWGIKGYVMMSRNKDNQCGIATKAAYPLV